MRRGIFRLMRNYHLHQLEVGRATLLALRELDGELRRARQEVGEIRQRLELLERRLGPPPQDDSGHDA